jgi:5-formyltetrahydrofolate cyclo-ligase
LPPEIIQDPKGEEFEKHDKRLSSKETHQNAQKVIQKLNKMKEKWGKKAILILLDTKQDSKQEEHISRLQVNLKPTDVRNLTPSKTHRRDEKEPKKEIWKI